MDTRLSAARQAGTCRKRGPSVTVWEADGVRAGWWASACMLFTGIYGTAWVAGSIVIGLLTDASVNGLVTFCMACEPAAIRLIWMIRTRSGHPPGSLRAERRGSGSRYQHGFSTRSGNDGK